MDPKEELWRHGLSEGRVLKFRPLGSSMAPTFQDGDVITVVGGQSCRIGEIILFDDGHGMVTHRVVAKFSDAVITKGDSLKYLDKPVLTRNLLGKVVALERLGKMSSLNSFRARLIGLASSLAVILVAKFHRAVLYSFKRLLKGNAAFSGGNFKGEFRVESK